jgi:hypothetical protein
MEKQGNNRSASGSGSNGNDRASARRGQQNYDVPIPRPTIDLGFRGIRRKRTEFDTAAIRRRDN